MAAVRTVRVVLTADVSNYDSKMQQAERSTSRWEAASQASAKAAAAGLVATATGGAALLATLVKTGVEYNTLQQTSRAALATLLGGAEAANKQMDKLDAFAKTSPFAKQVFITAQQQLIGFGLSASKVIPYLTAIQDATAAVGKGGDTVAAISGQIAAAVSGGIDGDFFKSLGSQGIDAAKIIGEQFGKSAGQVRAEIEAGTLGTTRALDALVTGLEKRYGGAAANVKQTWAGATDRIAAGWRDLGSKIAEPFVGHEGGGMAIAWANQFSEVLGALGKKAGPTIDHIVDKLSGIGGGGIDQFLDNLIEKINAFDPSSLDNGLDTAVSLMRDARDIATELLKILGTTGDAAATTFGIAAKVSEPFLQVVATLLGLFNSLPDGFKQLVAAGAIIALLVGRFGGFITAVRASSLAVGGLVTEMRTLYVMANANGVALSRMGAAGAVASGRLQAAGVTGKSAVGGIGVAAVLAVPLVTGLIDKVDEAMGHTVKGGDEAATTLADLANGSVQVGDAIDELGGKSQTFANGLRDIVKPGMWGQLSNVLNSMGLHNWTNDAQKALDSLDGGLAKLVQSGRTDQAAKALGVVAEEAGKQGVTLDELRGKLPQYASALQQAQTANNALGGSLDDLSGKAGLTTDELNNLAAAASKSAVQAFQQQTSVLTSWSASAYESALSQVASAQESVASAGRSMARGQRDAAEAMVEAQKRITDAQEAELAAQQDLNKARADAVVNLRELQEAVVDTSLDERAATLALQRAKLSLLDVEGSRHSSTLDQQEATLAVAQAERRLQDAQEARVDAVEKANDAQQRGIEGSQMVVEAQQRITDAATAVADAQVQAARQARSAQEQQADAARSYAQAQQALADAQAAAYKASLKGTFEETLRNARMFTDGIVELTRRGLDPALVAELLQAGPQQAAPVIEQLLSDHSGRLIAMANEAKTQFDSMSTQIAEITRLTNLAVNSNTDQMTQDLSLAMQIATLIAHGGVATSNELAATLGVGVDTVNRIRQEFGIGLAVPFSAPGLAQVNQDLQTFLNNMAGINNLTQNTKPIPVGSQQAYIPGASGTQVRAHGGEIFGVGGPTDDANLIWASKGEYMVKASAYADNRDLVQAINAGGKFQRLAQGGVVGATPVVSRPAISRAVSAPTAGVDARAVLQAVTTAVSGWRVQMDSKGLTRMVREQGRRDGLLGVR